LRTFHKLQIDCKQKLPKLVSLSQRYYLIYWKWTMPLLDFPKLSKEKNKTGCNEYFSTLKKLNIVKITGIQMASNLTATDSWKSPSQFLYSTWSCSKFFLINGKVQKNIQWPLKKVQLFTTLTQNQPKYWSWRGGFKGSS